MNASAMSARLRRVSRSLFCPEKLHSVLGMPSVLGALAFFQRFLIVAFVPLPGGRQHHWEGKRAANPPLLSPQCSPSPPTQRSHADASPSSSSFTERGIREEDARGGESEGWGWRGGAEGSAAPPALKGIFWRRGTGSRWSRRAQGMLGDVVRAGAGSQHG